VGSRVRYASDATSKVAPRIHRYALAPNRVPTKAQTARDSLAHAGRSPRDDAARGIVLRGAKRSWFMGEGLAAWPSPASSGRHLDLNLSRTFSAGGAGGRPTANPISPGAYSQDSIAGRF
jgi:hypothetical protein